MKEGVLVTGASGFIGCHLLPELVKEGYKVTAVSRAAHSEERDVTWVQGDMHHPEKLPEAALHEVRVLIDLAAVIPGVQESPEEGTAAERVRQRLVFLQSLPKLAHIALASTIDVYGPDRGEEVGESAAPCPETPYAIEKLMIEDAYRSYAREQGIPLTILRLAQVYGKGDRHIKAIPKFIEAVRNDESIRLAGEGKARRKYVHVSDVVRAVLLSLEQRPDDCVNIAGPETASVAEVLSHIEDALHKRAHIEAYDTDVIQGSTTLSIVRAKEILGYEPRVSLREGIAMTV